MRPPAEKSETLQKPELLDKSKVLSEYLKTLTAQQLTDIMKISPKLADVTKQLIYGWTENPHYQRPAIDSFLGDIYSGLQVQKWTDQDRIYANESLRILSGLYGVLKPLDGIYPYRLEMGYKLPDKQFSSLYQYWDESIAKTLPSDSLIIDLAAIEYSKVVTKYVDKELVVSPRFLTISPKTGQPTFVTVHAKVARGAFASWLIKNRIVAIDQLKDFEELGYKYDKKLSLPNCPAFVCKTFGGLGLSVRLIRLKYNQ